MVLSLALVGGSFVPQSASADPTRPAGDWRPVAQKWIPVPSAADPGPAVPARREVPSVQPVNVQPVRTEAVKVTGQRGGWLEAQGTPVRLRGAGAAEVAVLDVNRGNQIAMAFTVSAVDPIEVQVNAASLVDAGLVASTDRAALVELPDCFVTSPEAPECSAPVSVLARGADEAGYLASADVVTPGALLAVAAEPSGASGSYAAQPLAPSSLWSAGGATGEFTWSYPLALPDVGLAGGITPSMALSYNSSTVDGRIASTNNQAGLYGQGWSYEAGFVERRYVPCDSHPDGVAPGKGDLCWAGEALFLNLGARSSELVRDDASGTWRLRSDDGTRVERLTGAPNGALNGEHWKLTTPDGTQYFFGREALPGRTTQELTQSTWTVPVYGAASGDPCYSSAGFASSRCVQAWRWNLDYVENTHRSAIAYYYNKETNFYAANLGETRLQYTRGGVPLRIDYGLKNSSGSVYSSAPLARVVFAHQERCLVTADFTCDPSLFTAANATRWPDTPHDLKCGATGTCLVGSPTFWNQRRVTTITTQARTTTGSWLTRDVYTLAHTFPDPTDTSLWLRSITHTGYPESGAAISRAPVVFDHALMDNRVRGYNAFSPMPMMRMGRITDENGASMAVYYTPADCTAASVPSLADLSVNKRRCFPVKWSMPGNPAGITDFFHKYLVSKIVISDPQATSPSQIITYTYNGDPAWHYDDNELVKSGDRTWAQFRGYGSVDVRTGDPGNLSNGKADQQTLTRTFYLRGMHGNKTPGGAASVTLRNSVNQAFGDFDYLAGAPYETQSFAAATDTLPAVKTTTLYSSYNTTATRVRAGLTPLTATVMGVASQTTHTRVTTGTTWLTNTAVYTRDTLGRPTSVSTTATSASSSCSRTSYAQNTASNILVLPAEETVRAGSCEQATGTLLSGRRTYYDDGLTLGTVTGPGDATRTDTATTETGWGRTTASYDDSGRVITTTAYASASDGTGRMTQISYLPATGGPVRTVATTNPLGQAASVTYNIDGQPVMETTVSGQVTEAGYDALGRIYAVWEPGYPRSGPATRVYEYTSSLSAPETITTKTTTKIVGSTATRATSIALYDAFGQLFQTQHDAVGGGRIVNDTFYDSHGWPIRSNNHWYTTGAPSKTRVTTTDSAIDSRTVTTFDALSRPTAVISYKSLTETRRVRTLYTGEQTLVYPTTGYGINATFINGAGQTIRRHDYVSRPTLTGETFSGGTWRATSYAYDALGQMTGMTDPGGATWSWTYDAAGNRTRTDDPDTGTSTATFNDLGEKLTTTDARGTAGTLNYTYDKLGRITHLAGGLGNKPIAQWTYDTLRAGQLTESRSYVNGDTANPYIQRITGYDTYARPTGSSTVIPASEGSLAGTYTATLTYTPTGQIATQVLPAIGGLPAETITRTYTDQGLPNATTGANQYITATSYNPHALVSTRTGHEGDTLVKSYAYNLETLAIDATAFNGDSYRPQIQHNSYTRNADGRITKTSSAMNWASPAAVRVMCYRYDTRARITDAWTSTDNCAAAPSSTSATTGGVLPIWHQYTHNDTGARTKLVANKISTLTTPTVTTTYTPTTTGPKHATASETSANGTTTTTSTYTYDAAGNTATTKRGTTTETLTWDAQGKLTTTSRGASSTTYVRDADGAILLRKDPTGTTLYTPAGEVRKTTTATTGTRYYSHDGDTIAQRVGASLQALDGDHLGTSTVSVNWANLAQTTWRILDPYGNHLRTLGTWQTDHTFLNLPTDSTTGYVQTGARLYNPANGRFLSVDPLLDPSHATTLNGYSYTGADPINGSDPSGLATTPPQYYTIDDTGTTGIQRGDHKRNSPNNIANAKKVHSSGLTGGGGFGGGGGGSWDLVTPKASFPSEEDLAIVKQYAQLNIYYLGPLARYDQIFSGPMVRWSELTLLALSVSEDPAETPELEAIEEAIDAFGHGVTANYHLGKSAEDRVNAMNGTTGKSFRTSLGMRYVDSYDPVNQIITEVKVGKVSNRTFVRRQAAKDAEIMAQNPGMSATWVFYTSPVTGQGGPTPTLRTALRRDGIQIIELPWPER